MIRQIQNNDAYGTVIKKHVNGALVLLTLAWLQAGCNEIVRPAAVAPVIDLAGQSGPAVSVVAAGLLRGDGTSIGPVVNGLKISRVDTGELVIVFDGYRMPTAQSQYVVKVLPVNSSARASLLTVYFIEYLPEGIRFNVRHGNTNLSVADLQVAQFMFEVSLIE